MELDGNRVLAESLDNQSIIDARTKRLLLAEVYVHKRPKLTTNSDSVDSFEVFHIFEIHDDESKIIPKLSTNYSEPGKIIEVLKNFTGSDTPQLKRLIDKLCAQNEKWIKKRKIPKQLCSEDGLNSSPNIEAAQVSHSFVAAPNQISISTQNSVSLAIPIEHQDNGTNSKFHPIKSLTSIRKSISLATPNEHTNRVVNNEVTNQSIKLWNHIISDPDDNMNDTFELLVVEGKDKNVFTLKEPETDSTNVSSLKISQVFGSVDNGFVETLVIDRAKSKQMMHETQDTVRKRLIQTSKNQIQSRIVSDSQAAQEKTAKQNEHVVMSNNEVDLRCNFCLKSYEKFDELKEHMFTEHRFSFVCDICFEPFKFRSAYDRHRTGLSSCPCKANASRPYICIVDPPVILLKNNQVHAFKCRHCKLAFFIQKNYVKHAQKHAKSFRCKRCRTKPISAEQMALHLLSSDKH